MSYRADFARASAQLVAVLRQLGLDAEAKKEVARQRRVEAAFADGSVVEIQHRSEASI
jgi:hypothetical protein